MFSFSVPKLIFLKYKSLTYFVKDNFNSTLYPNDKKGNLRLVSGPIRVAENKHRNAPCQRGCQLVSRTFCTHPGSELVLLPLKPNTGCATGKETPDSVLLQNGTTPSTHFFLVLQIHNHLKSGDLFSYSPKTPQSFAGHSHLQRPLFFP